MFLSWLRENRKPQKRLGSYQPTLELLDDRIVPSSAHFVPGGTSSLLNTATGALTVNFHEAGLGNSVVVNMTLSAEEHCDYQWMNHGGQRPMGVPFLVDETISVTGTFTSDQNGQISGSLTLNPPSLAAFLSTNHAANWIPQLTISCTNVVVTDTTNGVSTADAGINLNPSLTVIHL